VLPVRYKVNFYILCRDNSVFKVLIRLLFKNILSEDKRVNIRLVVFMIYFKSIFIAIT
jgi:hypothetical protein